jgi:putative ABC transport system substrate-binding protein
MIGGEHQMRRRDAIALIVGGVATWPLKARSQQSKMPHIGVLWHAGSAEEEAIYLGAFVEGMKALGYIDGKTVALQHRFPNEIPERFRQLAAELVALKPDVLVAVTRLAACRTGSNRDGACQQPGKAGWQYNRAYANFGRAHRWRF